MMLIYKQRRRQTKYKEENTGKMEPKDESNKNGDFQNQIQQRVEKCEKTRHATRYEARVEKAKESNNNGNAKAKKNMKLGHNKK